MDKHVHTDECWEPDSGCDMGRNPEFAVRCDPEVEDEINKAVDSFLQREPPAYITHPDTRYSKVYDAYYNVNTRQWLETPCSDDDCEFCARRPDLAPLEE